MKYENIFLCILKIANFVHASYKSTILHFCPVREVPVMEASIIIAISASHRKEALEAVHFAIDSVKATVPIWKKVLILSFLNSLT